MVGGGGGRGVVVVEGGYRYWFRMDNEVDSVLQGEWDEEEHQHRICPDGFVTQPEKRSVYLQFLDFSGVPRKTSLLRIFVKYL